MPLVLAIDDDPSMLAAFRSILDAQDTQLVTASSAMEGLRTLAAAHPDVILLDVNLPDQSGFEVFRRIQQQDAKIPVIFVTGSGTTETAIEAMKLGAFDYLVKNNLLEPKETARLRGLVRRAFEISEFMHVPALVPGDESPKGPSESLIGCCPAMQEVYKAIGRVAPQDVTVLVTGESGTGKELVARAIYHHSRRSDGPFLALNCAAIPETLLESELFGHEKGAFTGANCKRIGKFEQCSGGTLFLDEVGDMAPLTQAKMLRIVQEQQFERVGSNETLHTNVRLIAATNRNLEVLVTSGGFRADLFYRLSVFTIALPPLRERGADEIRLLADHFVKQAAPNLGKKIRQVTEPTYELLAKHAWPGNVRELQSVMRQTLLQSTGPVLIPDFLPGYLRKDAAATQAKSETVATEWDGFIRKRLQESSTDLYAESLLIMERKLLKDVLQATGGNQVQAARILGISRNRLRSKLRKCGILGSRAGWSELDHQE